MSIQIAVRLSEQMVAFVDGIVASGRATSRADVVSRALAREQRLAAAERDVAILAAEVAGGIHDELDDMVSWTSAHPLDPDLD
jgi:Arc/MetJ-type ribon-helix-helix transcriptional regulator